MTRPSSSSWLSSSAAAAAQPVERVLRAEDDQLEAAVRGIERPPRTDPPGDDVAGVRDEDEVAADLELLTVGDDPEDGRREPGQLADRGADVRAEPHPALPLVLGGGHDPRVEAHPAGDEEHVLAVRRGASRRRRAPARPPEVDRPLAPWRIASTAARTLPSPSADASTLPVPPGTIASGIGRPARADAASRIVPSPPAATTSGGSGVDAELGDRGLRGGEVAVDDAGRAPGPGQDRVRDRLDDLAAASRIREPRRTRIHDDQRRRGVVRIGGGWSRWVVIVARS